MAFVLALRIPFLGKKKFVLVIDRQTNTLLFSSQIYDIRDNTY